MKSDKQKMKELYTAAIVMFVVSIVGLILTYKHIGIGFLTLTGCAIGTFLGTNKRYKNQAHLPKKAFLFLLFVAFCAIGLSLLLFFLLNAKSYIYIIALNVLAMAGSIVYINRSFK